MDYLFCAEAAVPESIVRLYAVVSVTDLVIRSRGRKRGSANFDLDRSKLRFASFTVDSPGLETQDEDKQCCADIRSPRAAKRVIFQAWVRGGECRHSKQQAPRKHVGRTAKAIRGRRRRRCPSRWEQRSWRRRWRVSVLKEVRGGFTLGLQISPEEPTSGQRHTAKSLFAEDVHKVGQVWPCQLPLHHLLCMRTGKPMPYIIKAIAKWYVRTVCNHRHSSGREWFMHGSHCCKFVLSSLNLPLTVHHMFSTLQI